MIESPGTARLDKCSNDGVYAGLVFDYDLGFGFRSTMKISFTVSEFPQFIGITVLFAAILLISRLE